MCVHTCETAVNEKRIHGRTGEKAARPYWEKASTAVYTEKSWHVRVHRENADTAVHTLRTLVEFSTAARSGMYADPSANR